MPEQIDGIDAKILHLIQSNAAGKLSFVRRLIRVSFKDLTVLHNKVHVFQLGNFLQRVT